MKLKAIKKPKLSTILYSVLKLYNIGALIVINNAFFQMFFGFKVILNEPNIPILFSEFFLTNIVLAYTCVELGKYLESKKHEV